MGNPGGPEKTARSAFQRQQIAVDLFFEIFRNIAYLTLTTHADNINVDFVVDVELKTIGNGSGDHGEHLRDRDF